MSHNYLPFSSLKHMYVEISKRDVLFSICSSQKIRCNMRNCAASVGGLGTNQAQRRGTVSSNHLYCAKKAADYLPACPNRSMYGNSASTEKYALSFFVVVIENSDLRTFSLFNHELHTRVRVIIVGFSSKQTYYNNQIRR